MMRKIDRDAAATLLHQYSEWLDGEGLVIPESELDGRTHDDCVAQFLAGRPDTWLPELDHPEPPSPVVGAQVTDQGPVERVAFGDADTYPEGYHPRIGQKLEPLVVEGYNDTDEPTGYSHAGHDHPATPAARAACRKEQGR